MCGFGGIVPPPEISNSIFLCKHYKEAGLYNQVGVMVFITSWRTTGLGMLTEWKNTCRSPVWSNACMGDSFSAASRAASSPKAGGAAKAVSRSSPCCVAPGRTSSAALTWSSSPGTPQAYGLGKQVTESRRQRRFMIAENTRASLSDRVFKITDVSTIFIAVYLLFNSCKQRNLSMEKELEPRGQNQQTF